MKKINKIFICLLLFGCLFAFAACGDKTGSDPENPNTPQDPNDPEKPGDPDDPEQPDPTKENYTISVSAVSGKPLRDFIVSIKNPLDSSFNVEPKMTNSSGKAVFSLEPNQYQVTIEASSGYYFDDDETVYTGIVSKDNKDLSVTCSTKLIMDEEPENGFKYSMGAPMYDFSETTSEGADWNLAEELEKHDLVVINFWYTSCSWCVQEFPYLQEAYEEYKDRISLIALNNGSDDSMSDVISFKSQYELTFNMALDTNNIASLFPISGYPTTVFIDRYGTADFFESSAILTKERWTRLFDSYLNEPYIPSYKGTGEGPDEPEKEKPDIEMSNPDDMAALVNASGFNGVFKPYVASDSDYNWPWIIDEDSQSITSSNSGKPNSFSIVKLEVELKKDQVFAFDYRTDCDDDDILYIVLNERIIFSASGVRKNYSTRYAYVAPEDGVYAFGFCYLKDKILDGGSDKIYLKNFRYTTIDEIDEFTYFLRDCSYGELLFDRWTNYIKPVFNQKDGYYHVGSETGPLVLADLLAGTHFSNDTIFSYFNDDDFIIEHPALEKYKKMIISYSSYATNSTVRGYVPVTEELKQALEDVVKEIGLASAHDNQNAWLEMCVYYNVYGPLDDIDIIDQETKQISDPIKGLAPFNCYDVVEDDPTTDEKEVTSLNYDRVITTDGFLFKFVPKKSGVYKIYTNITSGTRGYVLDADMEFYADYDDNLKYYSYGSGIGDSNFIIYAYFVKGETYYVKPCFDDVYETGMMSFITEYIDETADILTICSVWPFTTDTDFGDDSTPDIENNLVTIGIDAVLGEDGFYHEKYADGTISDKYIYVDIKNFYAFNFSLYQMIEKGAYDFTKTELGYPAFDDEGYLLDYYWEEDENGMVTSPEIKSRRLTDKNGQLIMKTDAYVDKTDRVKEIFDTEVIEAPGTELDGCIPVDEEIRIILQSLMDKYTFRGVEDSWQKCCYYYKHIAAPTNNN